MWLFRDETLHADRCRTERGHDSFLGRERQATKLVACVRYENTTRSIWSKKFEDSSEEDEVLVSAVW